MTGPLTRLAHPSPRQLLSALLEDPALVATVQALEPRVLGRVIEHVGLEDSGALVSLATTEQLARIFDDDLWRSERPGEDETFDAARFAVWLEVMLEVGEDFAAQKLAELPEDLVTLALHRHVLVVDLDVLAVELEGRGDDGDRTEKALDSCLGLERDRHRIVARREEGWDAVASVLTVLDRDHPELLDRILERCCHLSSESIEENGGLYQVLTAAETLESDVAADREARRDREGFVAPSAAASFLALARVTALRELVEAREPDPITRAHLRGLAPVAGSPGGPGRLPPRDPGGGGVASSVAALVARLEEAEGPRPAHLLLRANPAAAQPSHPAAALRHALAELEGDDPGLHARRMDELAYLANVLVAGCRLAGRSFRPFEAIEAVVATCNLGLEHLLQQRPAPISEVPPSRRAAAVLAREGADKLFRVVWRLLHEVSLAAAAALARELARCARAAVDRDAATQLTRAARAVRAAVAEGKPWVARRSLRAVADVLEVPTFTALEALLDECPSIAGDSGRGPDRASPRARLERTFIATEAQLRAAERLAGAS